jgi:hypothetical protein
MASASKLAYADHWRQIEANLPPEERSRTKDRRGRLRPYRLCPADLRETYILIGWEHICDHYHAHWSTVARWNDETGRSQLRADRAAYVREHGLTMLHPVK